jgi:hypothetical protein
MFHNHSQQEIIQKFISIDTTFIDMFGPNNNNSVMFGGANIACNNSMIQYPHSSTNAAILSRNYANDVPITSLVAGINNRKTTNTLKSKIFKVCPSDFTIHLPETLTNVIQMKVCAIDLPDPLFNISPYHKNNYVEINDVADNPSINTLRIELPSGNYTTEQIIEFLNNAIIANPTTLTSNRWRFFYNPITGKVFFSLSDTDVPVEEGGIPAVNADNLILKFSNETESCEGPKKYMSLGTILGFRKNEYGPEDYLDLTKGNFIVQNGVSMYEDGEETCNWPDYSRNDTYVPIVDYDKSGEGGVVNTFTPQGFVAEGSPTDNASSYLWLVIDDFAKEQKTDYMVVSTNRSEINSSKVYCKIPLKEGKVTFDTSYFVDDYKREYFNPTNIDKLHIKLIEPSGIPAYFAHSNFNLDIQFSCLR